MIFASRRWTKFKLQLKLTTQSVGMPQLKSDFTC